MKVDQGWLDAAIEASKDREPTGLHGSARLMLGKAELLTVQIEDGRVVGPAAVVAECEVPFSPSQVEALAEGSLNLAVEYMRGDLKPTGSTAAIVAVIDALDALASVAND
ncbi:MAG: hypothetical protein HKN24_14585 [Acidimicrobiales bacterium]|nr:hypothetical protein [Acidimicrobiales bacterium]